jgi:sulfopyruvate decarboxylase alpha subunit
MPEETQRGVAMQYSMKNSRIIVDALKAAGIDFVATLPDSFNTQVHKLIRDDPAFKWVVATREDEAMAIAGGAFLGGKKPCVIMEASGYGNCAGYLARIAIVHHIPLLILSSHVPALGEMYYHHSETRYLAEPVLKGCGIPYCALMRIEDADTIIREAQLTVEGQKVPVAIMIPRHIYYEGR